MFSGVIFDMDGVLIDSETFYFKRRMDFLDSIGCSPDSRELNDYVGKTEKGIWQTLVSEDEKKREKLYVLYDEYRKAHPISYPEVLMEGAQEVLEKLSKKGKKMAIASSSAECEIKRMVTETKLSGYFDFFISGESLVYSKPHPEIYHLAAERMGGRCAAVEDSRIGIKSAVSAGLYTFALKQPFPIDQSEADQVITKLADLLEHV